MKECPACSRKQGVKEIEPRIYVCPKCNAIFGNCYLGDSYNHVLPRMDMNPTAANERYFDFTCLGSQGVIRRHGWYNPETKLMTQVG